MNESLSSTASLLGDPGRAAILLRLMGGVALPAGELAATANVAPQTASEHLAKLVAGRFLTVERQGRHRYYRLAGAEIADAIEALLVLTARPAASRGASNAAPAHGTIEHARTCYGHLAGWLGVRITQGLLERGFIKDTHTKAYAVTPAGREWLATLDIQLPPTSSPVAQKKIARRCLDWTERRHHIAGLLGSALYKRCRELRWLAPIKDTRIVRVTIEGRARIWQLLRIPIGDHH
jgi:DNA-binding transcriptional ArsR family regulator